MIIVRLILRIALSVTALTLLNVEIPAQPSVVTGKAVFAGDAKVSTFPFEWHQGMIFLPVRVNGSKPLSFVLDSGSTRILIDRTLATGLGLGSQRNRLFARRRNWTHSDRIHSQRRHCASRR